MCAFGQINPISLSAYLRNGRSTVTVPGTLFIRSLVINLIFTWINCSMIARTLQSLINYSEKFRNEWKRHFECRVYLKCFRFLSLHNHNLICFFKRTNSENKKKTFMKLISGIRFTRNYPDNLQLYSFILQHYFPVF